MKRASSDALTRAARDVLGSLDDAEALARNPLVAPLFLAGARREAVLETIRHCVSCALNDLATKNSARARAVSARRREILARYDVQGEDCGTVARALGITVRHLYRERRAGLLEFAVELQRVLGSRTRLAEEDGPARLLLRAAFQTAAAGSVKVALGRLDGLRRAGAPAMESALASMAAAQLSFDGEDFAVAAGCIEAARAALDELSASTHASHREDLRALLAFARGRAAWNDGDLDNALKFEKDALEHFELRAATIDGGVESVELHLAVREILNCAVLNWDLGKSDGVQRALATARRLSERLRAVPPYLRIEMLNVGALVHSGSVGAEVSSTVALHDVAELATLHGYPGLASDALGLRAWAAMRRGDPVKAAALQRRALEAAQLTDSTNQLGTALAHSALIEIRTDPHHALELARSACDTLNGRPLLYAYAVLALGRAQLLCQDLRGAAETCRMLREASGKLAGNPTIRGAALRLSAYCALASGDGGRARSDIEASIDVLRSGAPKYALKASYRARSEIVALTVH